MVVATAVGWATPTVFLRERASATVGRNKSSARRDAETQKDTAKPSDEKDSWRFLPRRYVTPLSYCAFALSLFPLAQVPSPATIVSMVKRDGFGGRNMTSKNVPDTINSPESNHSLQDQVTGIADELKRRCDCPEA